MNIIDLLQVAGCVLALVLQLLATILAQSLRHLVSSRAWLLLMLLNMAVAARRFVSLLEIGWSWNGQWYETTVVLLGLCVSMFMMGTVVHLRRHIAMERKKSVELANATMELAHHVPKGEDSLAYQLALHFIRMREERGLPRDGVCIEEHGKIYPGTC